MRTRIFFLRFVLMAVIALASNGRGENVTYVFTGTGLHGSQAWGKFTIAVVTEPNYYAPGGIYYAISLTVSNIPGNSPGSVVFLKTELELFSAFTIAGGVPSILPQGGHDYGPPEQNHYDLGGGVAANQSVLTYNRAYRDEIAWSGLTIVLPPSQPVLSAAPGNESLINVFWTTNAPGFQLAETASLTPPVWVAVTNAPVVTAGNFLVALPKSGAGGHFFRLEWLGQ
jgi:hypothetical protein